MSSRILVGHVLDRLGELLDNSVQCVVTSPPYYGLRNYNTGPQIWGPPPGVICDHTWQTDRYYVEGGGGAGSSAEAFSEPGDANAARIKQARWRQDDTCTVCGAWRGHLGLEPRLEMYIDHLVQVFREVRRVLRDDGVLFLNMGDSYNNRARLRPSSHQPGLNGVVDSTWQKDAERGRTRMSLAELKEKDLMMVPERLAIALQADGWYVRSKMPWVKRNCMPESVTDRPTSAIEYVFMLTKRARYFWDHVAVRRPSVSMSGSGNGYNRPEQLSRGGRGSTEPWKPTSSRNFRNSDLFFDSLGLLLDDDGDPLALDVNPRGFHGAHFATFPTKLIEPLIQGGTSEKGGCPACAAPWKRVVERESTWPERKAAGAMKGNPGISATGQNSVHGDRTNHDLHGPVTTSGWGPGCTCDAGDPIPCTVLDPFVGSGTTLLVADRLGRDGIGVELLSAYGEMAADRVRNDAPMFTQVSLE